MNRTTAFGTWRFAEEYYRAAQAVERVATSDMDIAAPRYYLLGHALELSLKAFLLAKGIPAAELRNMKLFGHDLEKALVRSDELGLAALVTFSTEDRAAIKLLNLTYQAKEHEYITTGFVKWPQIPALIAIIEKILPAVRDICIAATREDYTS